MSATLAPPGIERKYVPLDRAEVKAAGAGSIEGYLSLWDTLDAYADVVVRGAFTKTIPQFIRRGSLLHEHDAARAIGTITSAVEDSRGLKIVADFHTDDESQRVRRLVGERLGRGKAVGLSIGFMPETVTYRSKRSGETLPPGAERVRELRQIALYEGSIVMIPALAEAGVSAVKSAGGPATMPAVESLDAIRTRLQRAGIVELGDRQALGARLAGALAAAPRSDSGPRSLRLDLDTRALVLGGPESIDARPDLARGGGQPTSLLDVLPSFTTEAGSVSIPTRTARSGAGPVADGAVKPSLTWTHASTGTPLATVASIAEVSTRALADGGAAMARVLDADLRAVVRESVEQQVVNGTGTGGEMLGIRRWAGIGSLAASGTDAAGIMAGIASVAKASKLRPDVVVISIDSWAAALESLATTGLAAELRAAGVAIVSTPSLVAGEALVGASATAPTFYRDGIAITTGSRDNLFVRNISLLRAEVEACVVVGQPTAWLALTGLGA